MTELAGILEKYFGQHLTTALGASEHTIAAYAHTWRLLFTYLVQRTGVSPDKIDLGILDAELISGFIHYLDNERHNSVSTRNARLAAVHSFFHYAAGRCPDHLDQIARVLAIPLKRDDRTDITYLDEAEITALLAAPDRSTRAGRRDHALLLTAITTGLRVAELRGLTWADVHFGAGAHLICRGKGRKSRATPLSRENVNVLTVWKAELSTDDGQPVFPTRTGTRMSSDAVAQRLALHVRAAVTTAPSLRSKTVTPHVLRHTMAMRLLHAGVDTSVIALMLGHERLETTQIYLHADLQMKERALERLRPTGTPPGHYQPEGKILAFLEGLVLCR